MATPPTSRRIEISRGSTRARAGRILATAIVMLRAVKKGHVRRQEQAAREDSPLLSGQEIDDLIGHLEERGGPPAASSPPRSGYVRAARPSEAPTARHAALPDDGDGIEELVDGVIDGWDDDVA